MNHPPDHGLLLALSVLRLSTGILLLYSLFLGLTRHKPLALVSPVEVSSVVVAHVQPRRALILTLLTFAAFTYLLDELIVLLYYLFEHVPSSSTYQWRGVELADVLGFTAFSFIIIFGITKDRAGMDFWSRKRLKVGVILALTLDIAYLVLLLLSVSIFQSTYFSFSTQRGTSKLLSELSLLLCFHRASQLPWYTRTSRCSWCQLAQFPPFPHR